MSFEDPLAGILSDGSDDSFFDDDILGKKKTTKIKNALPIAEKKNAIFNLEDDKQNKSKSIEALKNSSIDINKKNIEESKLNPISAKRPATRDSFKIQPTDSVKSPTKTKSSLSADKLNYLHEPKKEMEKYPEKSKSSQLLLDDILGGQPKKPGSSQARPATTTPIDFDLDSLLKSESSKTVPKKHTAQKQNNRKEDLASSKKKSSDDWLGLFQNEGDNLEDKAEMPSWLVGDTKKEKENRSDKKPVEQERVKKEEPKQDQKEQDETQKEAEPVKYVEDILPKKLVTVPNTNILHETSSDITTEGAAMYFQQQEAQLMVAMQLKAQEEKLAAIQLRQKESQRVQREAALAHHAQLDAMLKKQMESRHQMQAIIAAHQDRITQRIKALLSTEDGTADVINNMTEEVENPAIEQQESPYSREKKQLLQLVQSLQENHDKEIDLMETSYRRQLAFLEVSLNQSEERMKEESDKVVKFYTEKINWLDEHHQLYKKMTMENLNTLTESHKAENEMLRQQHLENIKVLQEHHGTLMENIKNTVKQEQVLIQDASGFSKDIHELVMDVKENKSQCQILVDKVQTLVNDTQEDVKKTLEIRESQINDMIQHLKKERETFDIEKTENRELVKMLESRLKQMTSMIEEETASLKQNRMEFEFEKATFNKETEFAKNTMKKREEEIKTLKEDTEKEYQHKINKIEEERNKILKESATIGKEKSAVINLKQELEKMKAELQAQLEQASEERLKINVEKQQVDMEEQRILAKSREIELLAKSAMEKQGQADKKYSEAEFLQRKYEESIRRIQEHIVSLNSREKQIAREKVVLSRERLSLHNERKQIESRQQCSLCKSTPNAAFNIDTGFTMPDTFVMPVSRDVNDVPVKSAMNAIEREMAHLMGRNFNLRHNVGIDNVNERDDRRIMRNAEDIVPNMLKTPQINSEPFKDYRDSKFMMLRLDVQKVLSNIEQSGDDVEHAELIDSE